MSGFFQRYPARGLFSLLLVYLIWGSTYLAIRYAVREGSGFPPFSMSGSRALLGGLILLGIAASLRHRIRITGKEAGLLLVSSILLWNGGNGLVTWAEQHAHSAYAALVVGSTPLYSAVVEALLNRRRPSLLLFSSLLLGLAGLFVLTQPALAAGTRADWSSTIALLLAPLSWSIGSAIQQRNPLAMSTLTSSGYLQLFAVAGFTVLVLATGEPRPDPAPEAWWGWAYLLVFGSVIGFTAFVHALRTLPVPVVMTYGFVNPVIAVYLGWLFLGEAVTPATLAGTALILAGVGGVFREKHVK